MRVLFSLVSLVLAVSPLAAQTSISRAQAIAAALATQPVIALAGADSAAARAAGTTARAYPNPTLSASYTRSVPRYHTTLDLPIDYPWLRGARIGAADAAGRAATLRVALTRAAVRFDADTSYTRALADAAHARIARRDALDADSLLRMAQRRRDAGDASDLDVRLAAINAGQLENTAVSDSLAAVLSLLDLQRLMGLESDSVDITLTDSSLVPGAAPASAAAMPLAIAAATADVQAAERTLTLERRSVVGVPSIQAGMEGGDPAGVETWPEALFGISIPLPIFDQHRGPIALAAANRDRARASLALVTRETDAARQRAARERQVAVDRAQRDRDLLESADRVAQMSLTAYAQGAAALPSVLEAQRNARAILSQYIDDVAAAEIADAALRLYTASPETP